MSYRSFDCTYGKGVHHVGMHTDEEAGTVCMTIGAPGADTYLHFSRADITRLLAACQMALADMNKGREAVVTLEAAE
jgi:hypothetical protein